MILVRDVEVAVTKVDVTDDYKVAVTLTEPDTRASVTVAYDLSEAEAVADALLRAKSEAMSALWEDRGAAKTAPHGFDVDLVTICRDCQEGKHGACIGSAHVERSDEIDEVACQCTATGHRGRS